MLTAGAYRPPCPDDPRRVAPRLLPRIRWAAGGVLFVLAGPGILLGGATGW